MRSRRGSGTGFRGFGLAFAIAAAIAACGLGGCSNDLGCDLDGTTKDLGGPGLIDCGLADFGETSIVDKCAVDAFENRDTFRAMYERKDKTVEAIVHGAGDHYYSVRASADGDDVERADCASASLVTKDSRDYVQCDKPGEFKKACD